MRRPALLAAAALPVVIATLAGAPTAVAASLDYSCTEADVRRVVEEAGPTQTDPQVLTSFANCQFRLYDDNDAETPDSPEVPHTFADDEWFVAGVLTWITKEELKSAGITKKQAVSMMDDIVDRLFLGVEGGPLVEIPIEATEYRTEHDRATKWLIIKHHYHVFEPGSLVPGTYEWRAEASGFADAQETFVTHGTLIITDGDAP